MSENKTKIKNFGIILIIIASFVAGRMTVTKEVEIKYKERIVKVTDIEKQKNSSEKKDVEVITRVIYKTDGTKIEEKREIDKTVYKMEDIVFKSEKIDKKVTLDKKVEYNKSKVTVSAFSIIPTNQPTFNQSPEIGILAQNQFLSLFDAGIGLSNQGNIIVSFGISFWN